MHVALEILSEGVVATSSIGNTQDCQTNTLLCIIKKTGKSLNYAFVDDAFDRTNRFSISSSIATDRTEVSIQGTVTNYATNLNFEATQIDSYITHVFTLIAHDGKGKV